MTATEKGVDASSAEVTRFSLASTVLFSSPLPSPPSTRPLA
jgi:hypothetical protein